MQIMPAFIASDVIYPWITGVSGELLSHSSSWLNTAISDSWAEMWDILVPGIGSNTPNLFWGEITRLSLFVAISTIGFYMLKLARDLIDGKMIDGYQKIFMGIIAVVFLANNAFLLGTFVHMTRYTFEGMNYAFQNVTINQIKLNEAYEKVKNTTVIESMASSVLQECVGLNSELQNQCVVSAIETINEEVGNNQWEVMSNNVLAYLQGIVDEFLNNPVANIASDVIGIATKPTLLILLAPVSLLVQTAFGNAVELAILLTGLIAPFAVGLSFFPFGQNALIVWVSSFFGVSILKISFGLIVGFSSVAIATADGGDPLFMPFFTILFAPPLAIAIGGFGGVSTFQAAYSGMNAIANAVVRVSFAVARTVAGAVI